MTKRQDRQGFTLIEAAVAIAVVAILSGIIVPLVVKNLRDSQRARALNDIQVIGAAVASQIKDTGNRPAFAAGPGGATGAGNSIWGSNGAAIAGVGVGVNNTFVNLFSTTPAATGGPAQVLFFGAAAAATITPNTEFAYKGPYLANDVSLKSDPWGRRYIILGYSAGSQAVNGPIWIVSAGPNNQILAANLAFAAGTGYLAAWNTTGVSGDDVVMRVN